MLKKSGGSGGYARFTITTSFVDKYVLNAFNNEYIPEVNKYFYGWGTTDIPLDESLVWTDSITNPQKLYDENGNEIQPLNTFPNTYTESIMGWDIVGNQIYCSYYEEWYELVNNSEYDFSKKITSVTYGKMKLVQ